VLDDLKAQFHKIKDPTPEQKRQYNEEVKKVQEIAKANPMDVMGEIGDHLGKFLDAYDTIEKLFLQEEREAKKVYRGEESVGRRALKRTLLRSQLSMMYADIRTEMTYNAPAELGDLWTRFEKMWNQILEEQRIAHEEELHKQQIEAWRRKRAIRRIKEKAVSVGAVVFVLIYLLAIMILLRKTLTFRGLTSFL